MIRGLLGLIGALWLAGCGALVGEDWGEPSPALWEASGPDGEQLWLFGTIHALPDGVDWRSETLEDAISQSDILIVEIADLDTPELQQTFTRLSQTPGQPPLPARVPAEDRGEVRRFMTNARADVGDFANVETWAAALLLARAVRENDPANGVDRALTKDAEVVIGLETIAGQLGIFDQLAPDVQADFLVLTARSSASNEGESATKAWYKGDMGTLERLTVQPLRDYPQLYAALLTDRNLAWVNAIEAELAAGRKPFIAVGGAHMLGPKGLPALLSENGYEVQRLQ